MNLAASLGIGPYGLLLPGALDRAVAMLGLAMGVNETVVQRHRRTKVEADALKARILAALARRQKEGAPWEENKAIALREGVSASYVNALANAAGITRKQRTPEERAALVAKARELMDTYPDMTQGQVADACGISAAYLSMLLGGKRGT